MNGRIGHRCWILLLCGALWLTATAAFGAQSGTPVDIEADRLRFDESSGRYVAEGHVRLTRQGLLLQGEQVWWNPETGEAQAQGAVRFESDRELLQAEKLWLNLKDQVGFARNGSLRIRGEGGRSIYVRGAYLERQGEGLYRVEQGRFTTCDGENPSWEMGASEVDLTVGGYARARNAVFYLRGTPVLYSPYLSLPVKRERESGLLTPRVGSSSTKGVEFSEAWYQVIADNQDATFYLDVLSKLGVGTGVEYRYLFDRQTEGSFKGYHVTGLGDGSDEDAIRWVHHGYLDAATRLVADVEWVSSKQYYENFGEAPAEYTRDTALSTLTLNHRFERMNFTGRIKYTKDLAGQNDATLQRLPELSLAFFRQPLGDSPLFTLLDADYTHFWREEGGRGQRLVLRPALTLVAQPLSVLELEGQVGYQQRFYWTQGFADDTRSVGVPDVSLRLSTRLARHFGAADAASRWGHSIEPELGYEMRPEADGAELPQFDTTDQLPAHRRLVAAVVNRLTRLERAADGRETSLEWLYLRLSQEYDLRGEAETSGGDPHWLPLRAELRWQPRRRLAVEADTRFRWDGGLDRNDLEASWQDDRENRLALGYRYHRGDFEYAYGDLQLSWFDPVYVRFRERFDLAASDALEHNLGLEYRHQCWSVFLDLKEHDNDRSVMLSFSLGGVGNVGRSGGSLDALGGG